MTEKDYNGFGIEYQTHARGHDQGRTHYLIFTPEPIEFCETQEGIDICSTPSIRFLRPEQVKALKKIYDLRMKKKKQIENFNNEMEGLGKILYGE